MKSSWSVQALFFSLMRIILAPLLLAGLLLNGCVRVGPEYQPLTPPSPQQWESYLAISGETQPAWWLELADPQLASLMERALRHNPDLALAKIRIREARANRFIIASATLPALDGVASFTHSRRSSSTSSGSSARSQDMAQLGFDASWEIDLFGFNQRQQEAAEASLAISEEQWRGALISLQAEVGKNYLELRSAQQRRAIAGEQIRLQEQTLALAQGRFAAGFAPQLEAIQAESQRAQVQAQLPALELAIEQSIFNLALLLGVKPQELASELRPDHAFPNFPQLLRIQPPSELLRRRPDIRAAEQELALATANVGAAVAALFPRFSLSSLLGLQGENLSDLLQAANPFWNIGPSIRWPIFHAGKLQAGKLISQARLEAAQINYEKTLLRAFAEVEQALTAYGREQQSRSLLTQALDASNKAAIMAQGQYKAGLSSLLSVVQTENALQQTQEKLAQANLRQALAFISLYKALGGGWQGADDAKQPKDSRFE